MTNPSNLRSQVTMPGLEHWNQINPRRDVSFPADRQTVIACGYIVEYDVNGKPVAEERVVVQVEFRWLDSAYSFRLGGGFEVDVTHWLPIVTME